MGPSSFIRGQAPIGAIISIIIISSDLRHYSSSNSTTNTDNIQQRKDQETR